MNKWDPEKLQEFIENIETVKVIDLENKLINSNNDNTCKQSINQYVHDLSEIFVDSAKKTLGTRTTKNSKQNIITNKTHKPWFTVQCKFQRQNYRKLKRKYKRFRTYAVNQRLPGACNRSPGSMLLSITTQLHCGGHLGGRARLSDTILEEDHPMTIPSKFGSN
jgi:hypothetical protein